MAPLQAAAARHRTTIQEKKRRDVCCRYRLGRWNPCQARCLVTAAACSTVCWSWQLFTVSASIYCPQPRRLTSEDEAPHFLRIQEQCDDTTLGSTLAISLVKRTPSTSPDLQARSRFLVSTSDKAKPSSGSVPTLLHTAIIAPQISNEPFTSTTWI